MWNGNKYVLKFKKNHAINTECGMIQQSSCDKWYLFFVKGKVRELQCLQDDIIKAFFFFYWGSIFILFFEVVRKNKRLLYSSFNADTLVP